MASRADIAVHDADGQLQLVVEVKNRSGTSAEWAIQMRRNLLIHGLVSHSPYFLLALPDTFYLWKPHPQHDFETPPDYRIDAVDAFALTDYGTTQLLGDIDQFGHDSLELLVASWLEYLTWADIKQDNARPGPSWLFDSGLYQAIKNGTVTTEVTA